MAEVGASGPTAGWSDRVNDWFPVVHRMIAAANSIPEGPPVDTIALHPSVKWIAHRDTPDTWEYIPFRGAVLLEHGDEADSWPVIFTPGEAVGSGPTTDGGGTYDPTGPDIWRVAKWLDDHYDGEAYEIYEPDGATGYRLSLQKIGPHPTARQEPAYTVAAASEEMAKYWDNRIVTTTKRELRVVDRLGVDEQGSRWEDVIGDVWNWDERGWHSVADYGPTSPVPYLAGETALHGPFKEILEPRVLPSLDCEEARDGTVWTEKTGEWVYWFNESGWRTDSGILGGDYPLYQPRLLSIVGPYTEVLPDVG